MDEDQRGNVVAPVAAQLAAYNRGDIARFRECFDPDVEVRDLATGELLLSGLEPFTEAYRRLFSDNPKLHCELKSRIALTDIVIDEEFVTGNAKFPDGLHVVAIYQVRPPRIRRVWFAR
jgi:hypothetical protein